MDEMLSIRMLYWTKWIGFACAALSMTLSAYSKDVASIFVENCAGCHGADMKTGQINLLMSHLRHGEDDESLAESIRKGHPDAGMPGWQNTPKETDIRALVIYIKEKRAQAANSATVFARPKFNETVSSQEHKFKLELVADGLDTPWSVAFLPDHRILITELPGTLRYIDPSGRVSAPITGTPKVRAQGQGGLMAVALHPGYATNGWVYLTYSDRASNSIAANAGMTAVVRGKLKNMAWTSEETIFRARTEQYCPGDIHFGSRIVFDKEGHIFFTIGERGIKEYAQLVTRPNGKVHRLFDDGRVPEDNPFVGVPDAIPSVWSYGHRNPQGLSMNPITGDLWETEHGPRGGDELNLIRKGLNYGWPITTYGMNYDGTPITDLTHKDGLEQPAIHWTPSIAVCALTYYSGNKFAKWQNNLFATALAQQELRRIVLDGRSVVKQEVLFKNIGRVREVAQGPDGLIYVALNKPDLLMRLVPTN